ncbi:MAG: response regulator [Rhodospirillaceae bacterium]|nr:response regulator [Rhodospirillaceae bacterium]
MSPLTLLLVDDSPDDREAIRRTFARSSAADVTLVEASTLKDAEQALLDRRFHCVLLDYRLPDAQGMEAISRIAELSPATPIVMITAYGDETVAAAAFRSGATDYLGKATLSNEEIVDRILDIVTGSDDADADDFRTLRVLVVDDSPEDRELVVRTLLAVNSPQYRVDTAATGAEALQSVDESPPDCIVLDYSLPGISGLQLLTRFRKSHPSMPVVVVTGQGSEATAVEAIRGGAQGYLPKSAITRTDLHRCVRDSVRKSRTVDRAEATRRRLEELAQDLRRANADLDGFVHAPSNDLRVPLRALLALPDWLARDLESAFGQVPATIADSVGLMRSHLRRMDAMIDRLAEHTTFGADIEKDVIARLEDLEHLNRELRDTVRQRDLLLGEVNHRVKNNLQLIDAMLAIEAEGVKDAALTERFLHVRRRIASIGLVHQRILESPDLATFDASGFVGDICRYLAEGFDMAGRGITLVTDISPLSIDIDRAIPLGLILNELVSNALKHAFPAGRPGTVAVRMAPDGPEAVVLEVIDDGIGFAPQASSKTWSGSQILQALVGQLRGTLVIEGDDGTRATVRMAAWR